MKNFILGFILGLGYGIMWTTFILGVEIMIFGCIVYLIALRLDMEDE